MSYSTYSNPYVETTSVLKSWNKKWPVLEQSDVYRVENSLFIFKGNQTLKTYEVCLRCQAELNKFDVSVKFVLHIKEI